MEAVLEHPEKTESSEKQGNKHEKNLIQSEYKFYSARCDIPFLFFANAELWPCGSAHNVTIPRFTNDKTSAS